jgi:hypothetical protein
MSYTEQVKAGKVNPNFKNFVAVYHRYFAHMSMNCRLCHNTGKEAPAFMGLGEGSAPKGASVTGWDNGATMLRQAIARATMVHYENEHSDHPMLKKAPWRS